MEAAPSALPSGLYLHRSELHAQRELDLHVRRTGPPKVSLRAWGRKEGHAAGKGCPFKPLGILKGREEVQEMQDNMLLKVDREVAKVVASMHSKEQPKTKRSSDQHDWNSGPDGGRDDGDDHEDKEAAEQAEQQTNDGAQYRREGPRRGYQRGGADGLITLRTFVRESELRLQAVKTFTPGTLFGLADQGSEIERLMPPRFLYPASHQIAAQRQLEDSALPQSARGRNHGRPRGGGGNAGGGGKAGGAVASSAAPHSAREAHPLAPSAPSAPGAVGGRGRRGPRLPMGGKDRAATEAFTARAMMVETRPRSMPVQLPTLDEFIASSGPTLGDRGGGATAGGERAKVREAANELLGMDRHKALKLTQEELTSKRKINFKRKIEKQLDVAWTDKLFYRRMDVANVKEFSPDEPGRWAGGPEEQNGLAGAGGAAGAGGVGGGDAAPPSGGVAGEEGGVVAAAGVGSGRRKRGEPAKVPTQEEEASAYEKVEQMLREPDPGISPVGRLRTTLAQYQASRDRHRGYLEATLSALETDRLDSLKRRAVHLQPCSEDAQSCCALMRVEAEKDMLRLHLDEGMKRQYLWYRSLWTYVQSDKREMKENNVAHFIFDFVRKVLEHGKAFRSDMYFAMLGEIEDYEFSFVISSLVVSMINEIEGATHEAILQWFFDNRGSVPSHVADRIASATEAELAADVPAVAAMRPPTEGSGAGGSGAGGAGGAAVGRSVTFVTEGP